MFFPCSQQCAQPQDLFKQYDDGPLTVSTLNTGGVFLARSAFYGGMNVYNVQSGVHITQSSDCSNPAGGVLLSPHNAGVITSTGPSGMLVAIVDVVNEKLSDPKQGVKLGGHADYLLVGGSNAGNVDINTTGYVSVVGLNNKGVVSAKGADNFVIANTTNSNKVVLAAKTGKIINVGNLAGGEVVIESGTWKFDGPTSNEGVVRVKSGQVSGNVKENAGTIIIESGVKGKVVFCKRGSGEIKNYAKVEISVEPGACMRVHCMGNEC